MGGTCRGPEPRASNAPRSRSGWDGGGHRLRSGFSSDTRSCRSIGEGIAISTFGKVIKRGWDWLGITPANPRIGGLIEVPDLAACLTLSKNDFIRTGTRGATYLAYRKAVQEVVSRQLTWGAAPGAEARPRIARLERDLERVLEDLADAFPLLQSLVDRRAGGQKRFRCPGADTSRCPRRSSRTSRQATKAQSSNRSIRNVPSRRDSRRSRTGVWNRGNRRTRIPAETLSRRRTRSDSH